MQKHWMLKYGVTVGKGAGAGIKLHLIVPRKISGKLDKRLHIKPGS